MIERTFRDIPKGRLEEEAQQAYLASLTSRVGSTWNELLESRRVFIISEAGAGKTFECDAQAKRLWRNGEPAFFVELSALAGKDLRFMLDPDEEARFDEWLASQSDLATFFLDSIDELQLTPGTFRQALTNLRRAVGNRLARVRLIVTTRPIPFDAELVRHLLPVPPPTPAVPSGEAFADVAMRRSTASPDPDEQRAPPDWRTVALSPLSDAEILEFARLQGVEHPQALLDDLQKRNAQDFTRRPQDLIELCADWRVHGRIRTHRDQVETNVRVKLLPRDDRPERAELSAAKAIEGASRLALAMQVTRRTTIRHSAASDDIHEEVALDPATILSDWSPNERRTLLERALFGFASYGRVRFHHRSVVEYLAAVRLKALRDGGAPYRALKRLLFAELRGETVVRPSKRPVAAWLALMESGVYETLRDHEPAVLLDEGDPEALTQPQRNEVFREYVRRFGHGGWRGLTIPSVQVHRFASSHLAPEVHRLWRGGIQNVDVRDLILTMIAVGPIPGCVDIAQGVASDPNADANERVMAIDAMLAVNDPQLTAIASELTASQACWPEPIARRLILRLFPQYLSVHQLCQVLGWMQGTGDGASELTWGLPERIETAALDQLELEALRDGLVDSLSAGLRWRESLPHVTCDRAHLADALAATCARGLEQSRADAWLQAAVLALRLKDGHEYSHSDAPKKLRAKLANPTAEENERLFWAEDDLVQSLRPTDDPWTRLAETMLGDGPVELRPDRDSPWIESALADESRSHGDRAMLLQAAMFLASRSEPPQQHVAALKPFVADRPDLVAVIDERLAPPKRDEEFERLQAKVAKRAERQKQKLAKGRDNWMQFWHEVSQSPDTAFSSEQRWRTAWNLWQAVRQDGDYSRGSGWNRRLIEQHFNKDTADQLRRALMQIWREECPTLHSERPEDERNTMLVRWQLGLAALYAEAEDPRWASKLSPEEAKLATRFVPIELNELPAWLEGLIAVHLVEVDAVLGNELTWELSQPEGTTSILLQHVGYAEPAAKLFLPRLCDWLDRQGAVDPNASDSALSADRLRQVIGVLIAHGDEDVSAGVRSMCHRCLSLDLPDEYTHAWLTTAMRVDPELGVSVLHEQVRDVEPDARSRAVHLFGTLFGDAGPRIDLAVPPFTPSLLLQLLRLAHHHVRPVDDARHVGTYTPDIRDDAESARNRLLDAILAAPGEDGWNAKLELANDALVPHMKDRILAFAQERSAQEIDSRPFDEDQALALDQYGEAPASTNEGMFAILTDRLDDLDEFLLRDTSPRELWQSISDEKLLRREIAREFRNMANGLYTVDQEAVTADENETDIRLRSTVSDHEAVIELKRADHRSAADLRTAISEQLVEKYLAPEITRSGCLLVSLAKDRKWQHPDSGDQINVTELMILLSAEAKRLEQGIGDLRLGVRFLDLRPRLTRGNEGLTS